MQLKGTHATYEDLAKELADVVICAVLLADSAGIDLDGAVTDKFNETSTKYDLNVFIGDDGGLVKGRVA